MNLSTSLPASTIVTPGNDGFGGNGLIGGLLLGSLARGGLGGYGGYGGYGGEGCVTPSLLSTSFSNATDTAMNTTVLQTLGDIKASVPLAEGQVQLALAGAQASINGNINSAATGINANISQGLQVAVNGQAGINKNISESIASALAAASANKEATLSMGSANLQATNQAKFEISQIVKDDGEKTRSLITANQIAELNRLAAERQDEIIELRGNAARERDRRDIEINMNNFQNQNQLQFQAQAQALNNISSGVISALQNIQATNQAINIGGLQQANPTNTNTNVRA